MSENLIAMRTGTLKARSEWKNFYTPSVNANFLLHSLLKTSLTKRISESRTRLKQISNNVKVNDVIRQVYSLALYVPVAEVPAQRR